MTTQMLIDASHNEETRIVVLDSYNRVQEFDIEAESKRPLRGNIYLAKVTRVEPAFEAVFVEYGGNRQGFLAFSDIHPDYYQIPQADRAALLEAYAAEARQNEADDDENDTHETESETVSDTPNANDEDSAEDTEKAQASKNNSEDESPSDESEDESGDERKVAQEAMRELMSKYKIQEVIKPKQIILVQVVKEERGNKGAALTTYLSLAGRYCVLMPNSARGGGVSRKIANSSDRRKLKKIAAQLEIPETMGLIIRTAGARRSDTEITHDYNYLIQTWNTIRADVMQSIAPACVHEEGNIVKRTIRDVSDKDLSRIIIEGDTAYQQVRNYIEQFMPDHTDKVSQHDSKTPIFQAYKAEDQLVALFNPIVHLPSGGYLVINPTEALVSVDVNSGKSTRGDSIEQTALNTNLEAAEELARQMRLRDLAGLIVIDFIDMYSNRHNRAVEKCLKDALKNDRARLRVGRISSFGLLEMSRQRTRSGVLEGSSEQCPHCGGSGHLRSIESRALHVLRVLEESNVKGERIAQAPQDVVDYILNRKRAHLLQIEESNNVRVAVRANAELYAMEMIPPGANESITRMDGNPEAAMPAKKKRSGTQKRANATANNEPRENKNRTKRGGRKNRNDANRAKQNRDAIEESNQSESEQDTKTQEKKADEETPKRRRGHLRNRRQRTDIKEGAKEGAKQNTKQDTKQNRAPDISPAEDKADKLEDMPDIPAFTPPPEPTPEASIDPTEDNSARRGWWRR